MKIDYEYFKGLLEAFEKAVGPFTDIMELRENGYSYETDEFLFHMSILWDKGLLEGKENAESAFKAFGCHLGGASNEYREWGVIPLRLTADGHDFLANLRQPDVFETIKTKFKDQGISGLVMVAKEIAKASIKKKVGELEL